MNGTLSEKPLRTADTHGSATGTRQEADADGTEPDPAAGPSLPAGVRPLPVWFFAFEGAVGSAFDLCRAWQWAWVPLAVLGLTNMIIGLTVMRRRAKLVRAMLRNSRTRRIALGLIALRLGVHLVLGAAGAQITSAAGHLVVGLLMGAATVALLWWNQRVTFRALGLGGGPAA